MQGMSYDEYTSCEIKVLGTVSSTCLPGYSIAWKCSCLLGLGDAHLNAACPLPIALGAS